MERQWPRRVVQWFRKAHRPMPWRSDPSPYKVWVSEIMLQQTQVATVIPYFDRFIARFPCVHDLAGASLHAVMLAWEGLGYYSRARNLHAAARYIVAELGGAIPRTSQALAELPGIGAYSSAAIASIAFGESVPAVDGNVMRVCARLWGMDRPMGAAVLASEVRNRLRPCIRNVDPSHFNQAMMEIGALLCRPRNPKCPVCPLALDCVGVRVGRPADFPVKRRKPQVPHYVLAAGVVCRHGRVVIVKRREKEMLAGLWEFPCGRKHQGESEDAAVARVVRLFAGIPVMVQGRVAVFQHAYSHFRVTVKAFQCAGNAKADTGSMPPRQAKWVFPKDLVRYPMSRVSRRIADAICRVARQSQTIES